MDAIPDHAYDLLPMHMREHVREYIERGKPIGDFLTAVFANDLCDALGRADTINARSLKNYAVFLHTYVPAIPIPAWGSRYHVRQWIKLGGLAGLRAMTGEQWAAVQEKARADRERVEQALKREDADA
jgi:hypothetical protein